jgi:hypothetical protein
LLPKQASNSFAGRLDRRLALLSRERLDAAVVERVVRWAALGGNDSVGGGSSGDEAAGGALAAMLAEDAAEVGLQKLGASQRCNGIRQLQH